MFRRVLVKRWCKLSDYGDKAVECRSKVLEGIHKLQKCATVGGTKVLACRVVQENINPLAWRRSEQETLGKALRRIFSVTCNIHLSF